MARLAALRDVELVEAPAYLLAGQQGLAGARDLEEPVPLVALGARFPPDAASGFALRLVEAVQVCDLLQRALPRALLALAPALLLSSGAADRAAFF